MALLLLSARGLWSLRLRVKSRLLGGDQSERRPIEIGVAARNSRDYPISHDVYRRHRDARAFRLGKSQAHVLERESHKESGRIGLPDNLVAVNLMRPPAEHRARHNVEEGLWIEPAFAEHGNDFAKHLQRSCRHHVAEQLGEVRLRRIGADHKRLLSETV